MTEQSHALSSRTTRVEKESLYALIRILPSILEYSSIEQLNRVIIGCKRCNRLVKFREKVAANKRGKFLESEYWGKPVTGYGDPNARLVVLGLAPAAHGANRTGRVFTGDKSARFLVAHLHKFGFANQSRSEYRDDGLKYNDCFVTAVVRCVPPNDKPTREEIQNCSRYLEEEMKFLTRSQVVLALGRVAFLSYLKYIEKRYGIKGKFQFEHGKKYCLSSALPILYASYHPSPRNTNTGKLTNAMFRTVLRSIRNSIDQSSKPK